MGLSGAAGVCGWEREAIVLKKLWDRGWRCNAEEEGRRVFESVKQVAVLRANWKWMTPLSWVESLTCCWGKRVSVELDLDLVEGERVCAEYVKNLLQFQGAGVG